MQMFLSDTHWSAESTEEMGIKCLAQGHKILMQLRAVFLCSGIVFYNMHYPFKIFLT